MNDDPQPQRLPSLDLVRKFTDRRIVETVLSEAQLTRAEIAAMTGISKPTVSESVRRLTEAGVLDASGRQVGKRGPAGLFYRLRPDLGVALTMVAGPEGVVVETFDLRGDLLAHLDRQVEVPIDAARLNPVMVDALGSVLAETIAPIRSCAVSVAGPVDQRTGHLVRLPNAPFLTDELTVRELVEEQVTAPMRIDNDVNWIALAEHHEGNARGYDDFLLCYLGAGIGGAVVSGGTVLGGYRGLAGELAHLATTGPNGLSMRLIECFSAWDLLQSGSAAIDIDRVREVLGGGTEPDRRLRDLIADAVAGALKSAVALLNPEAVLIAGPWGTAADFDELVAGRVSSESAVDVVMRRAALTTTAPRIGTRIQAVAAARAALLDDL